MKKIKAAWFGAALCLIMVAFLSACTTGERADATGFNKEIYTPEYASGFDIRGNEKGDAVLITTRSPWQGADSVGTQLLILAPEAEKPENFSGQVLRGEARRIVAMSSTHVAMLDALGEDRRVAGVSGLDFIYNSSIRERRDSIGDVGFEGSIDYELLAALNPDLIMLYGVDGASSMEGKLKELGIPYVYIGDYLEESPLGKAEWVVAIAEIIGKRREGMEYFSKIPVKYNELTKKVKEAGGSAPKVMLNSPYGDLWQMASAESFMGRLIRDAGGDYLYRKDTGNTSMPIDMEEAYLLTHEADFWLNPGTAVSLGELAQLCPKFTDAPCFTGKRVYNNNKRSTPSGGNDFYESGSVNPHLVLQDLIKIFHPGLIEEDFTYYYPLQ